MTGAQFMVPYVLGSVDEKKSGVFVLVCSGRFNERAIVQC